MVIATVALIAIGLTAWATPTASANGGPHGNFTLTTSGCGGCHRAHTAISPYLIKAENEYELCTSCHGGVVSTDVVHGQYLSTGAPLNGGGFEMAVRMSDFIAGTPVAGAVGPVSSSHTVADLLVSGVPASGSGSPWGSTTSGVATGPGTLECTSCHNPHGSTNYRILRDAGTGSTINPKWIPKNPDLLDWVNYQVLATTDDTPAVYGFTLDNSNCPSFGISVIGGTPRAINTAVSSFGGGTPGVADVNTVVPATTPPPGTTLTPEVRAGAYIRCKARYTSGVFAYSTGTPVARGATAVPNPLKGMNAFCATCHKAYLTISGSAQNFNSQNVPTDAYKTAIAWPTSTAGPGGVPPAGAATLPAGSYLTAVAQWPPVLGPTNTPVPGTVVSGATYTPVPLATIPAGLGYPYVYPGTQQLDPLNSLDNLARYRHAVDRTHSGGKQPLRFAALGNDPSGGPSGPAYAAFGCLTCHFAHGSAAAATPAALTGGWVAPAEDPGPDGPAGDSSLLFYSNRGVCITCHQALGPVPTPTNY
jgi:predicted CXXCH cytochrome family protein